MTSLTIHRGLCCVGLLLLLSATAIGQFKDPMTDKCMACVCEASFKSTNCGITFQFWFQAGSPLLHRNSRYLGLSSFVECTNNKECAKRTVFGYMHRYRKDCNKDGYVRCSDYALMHQLGHVECQSDKEPHKEYMDAFNRCLREIEEF